MNEGNIESNPASGELPQQAPAVEPEVPSAPPPKIGKFKASLMITRASWELLKKDKEMMLFPIISTIVSLVAIAIAIMGFFFLALGGQLDNLEKYQQGSYAVELIVAFVFYFVTVFITIFFETGIITIVRGRLNDQNLTFSDGMKNAFSKIGKIAAWSLLAATIGLILKSISDRSKLLGKIVVTILGAAWSILTFFIAPILIAEELSIKDSLKKSASIISKVWGETVIVNIGVSFFFGIIIMLGFFVFIITLFAAKVAIIIPSAILFVAYVIILAVISSTLGVIFRVVLYEYANTGKVAEGFSGDVINMAFKAKK